MDELLNKKKVWETPQIEDLDIKQTKSGSYTWSVENAWYSPS